MPPIHLTKPDVDSTGWGPDVNKNFSDIEALVNSNESDIGDNAVSIGNNAADIIVNAGLIADNAAGVAANAADLGGHDRGDPTEKDFDETDLITDATWRDLDLSPFVPVGTTLVLLYTYIKDDLAGQVFAFRTKGNAANFNMSLRTTVIANQSAYHDMFVHVDADRVIQYYASDTVWSDIDITVRAWWKGA